MTFRATVDHVIASLGCISTVHPSLAEALAWASAYPDAVRVLIERVAE